MAVVSSEISLITIQTNFIFQVTVAFANPFLSYAGGQYIAMLVQL